MAVGILEGAVIADSARFFGFSPPAGHRNHNGPMESADFLANGFLLSKLKLWKIIHFLFLKLQNVSCAYTGWSHTVSSQPIGRRSFVNLGQKWRSEKKWKARIIPSLEFSSYIVYNDEYKFLAFYVLSITLSIIILYIEKCSFIDLVSYVTCRYQVHTVHKNKERITHRWKVPGTW